MPPCRRKGGEDGGRQLEHQSNHAANQELQSASEAFAQESLSWQHSEQLASSQNVRLAQAEQFERQNSMISRLEQQAESRHIAQMSELRHSAQLKFQEQETRTHSLEEELIRLQGELIRSSSQC